jgi:alcohol dehydrogenase class IV
VIPRLLLDQGDRNARAEAAFAALLMGANLANSTTCLPHRLQYPVGAATRAGHAAGVAALFPAWLQRTLVLGTEPLARLAIAAGLSDAADPREAATALVEAVDHHLGATSFRWRLADFGITEPDIPRLVEAVEGTLENDPGPVAPADLADLYRASL